MLLQSVELLADREAVHELTSRMDANTLVTGLAIDHFHRFKPGRQPLGGLTAPWNTFAVWNVEMLGRTGFLPISDGVRTHHFLNLYMLFVVCSLSLSLF